MILFFPKIWAWKYLEAYKLMMFIVELGITGNFYLLFFEDSVI